MDTPLNVGLFCDGYFPSVDGVTLTAYNYAKWLTNTGNQACIVAPETPGYEDKDDFPVIRHFSLPLKQRPQYRVGIPQFDLATRIKLDKENFSIVHAHAPFLTGHLALSIARNKGIPIVATFHSKYRDDFGTTIKNESILDGGMKLIAEFYARADEVWVPQQSVGETLRSYGYTGEFIVMENGIDFAVPDDIGPYRQRGAVRLGFGEEVFMGLFVGQHIRQKNLEFLMRALRPICAARSDFRMVFVGEGYFKDEMIAMAGELGIADRIIFHPLVTDREILKEFYARADLLLFPSIYDNAPLVLREAAAFRTPAVLIGGTDAASVVTPGVSGFTTQNDEEDFVATVVRLAGNRELVRSVGETASKALCRSWENVVAEAASRYRTLIARNSRR